MEIFYQIFRNETFTKMIILPLIFILVAYLYERYKLNYWKRKGVKQLSKTNLIFSVFKNMTLFRNARGYTMDDIYKADIDTPFVGFYIFHKPCLLLKDMEIIKQLLIRDFDNFPDRHFAGVQQKDSLGAKNLFGVNNPTWKYLRQKITPTLTKSKQKQMLPLMTDNAKSMMNYLRNNFGDNNDTKSIDIQDLNYKYAADLIANIALGTKTDSFEFPESDYIKSIISYFRSFKRMVALITVLYVPEIVAIFGSTILFNTAFLRKIFWNSVESREKSGIKRGDFIDSIIELKNGTQDPMCPFDDENIFFQAISVLSGFESSTIAASSALIELAKHKKYQDRARQDVKNAVGKHGWTIRAFDDMKYLCHCIEESNRLHPALNTLDRCTMRDYKESVLLNPDGDGAWWYGFLLTCTIEIPNTNVCIEKGTPIFISIYALHRDKRYFDEPEIYNPDRFGDDRIKSEAYIPFGVGRRKCVGINLGLLHVKIVTAMILSEYEISQPRKENNAFNLEFTKLTY